ncbi:SN-glycerol-3-phosphate ABC superfamily ATP binding cassette transporter, membrane protein [Sporosarcina newyorkensis 2681]|uniref:SN-glycerol-3-phosphate ABC superfamily ATP binding cassette transporter, membrane protein n=1 Tax=Sporosarcina newyorkensis 2681 TaxID=1027292 RepID=F9DXB2_9BACL|nr:carbohydrate ABC transporter permease [Sporosarcina newyorkensis]EGQ21006.1 SN-glycerol-3-phosphate ABC superfamily ATP binding cassette transporter, membrane protein [Sporosarcina newyorkensis 2681]
MRISRHVESIWHFIFMVTVLVMVFPIIYAFGMSFKPLEDAYNNVLNILPINASLENYRTLFASLPVLKITMNTFVVASVATVFKLVTSFLAAYAFVYFKFKGKEVIYFLLIGTIFIPFTVTMIPNYLIISEIGMLDSVWGVILPQLADAVGIFLIHQAMKNIPVSLIEVARLDNMGHGRIMKDIVLPLVRPAVTSVGIWFFIGTWNEFVWPVLVLKTTENYTLPLALQMFISSEGGTNFTVAMAVSVITMIIPLILYLTFQKYIIGTFTSSGIK